MTHVLHPSLSPTPNTYVPYNAPQLLQISSGLNSSGASSSILEVTLDV